MSRHVLVNGRHKDKFKLILVLVVVTSGFVKALYFIFLLKENQVMIHKFVCDDKSLFSEFCVSL